MMLLKDVAAATPSQLPGGVKLLAGGGGHRNLFLCGEYQLPQPEA